MSLISLATRTILQEMLRGRTWAEDRILDQPIDPIQEVLRGADERGKPVIAVYTSKAEGKPTGLDTQAGVQSIDLNVYVYLPPRKIELPESVEFEIDNSGAGLALNVMGRQIDAAMHYGNADWIKLWRSFVLSVEKRTDRFVLVEIERGLPVPCLEILYEIRAVAEADFAKPLYGAWVDLDTLLRASEVPGSTDLADLIKGLIESPEDLFGYEVFQLNHGLTDEAYMAIGLAPLATNEDRSVPDVEEIDARPDELVITPPGRVP
ncbi:MAG: hypothetical protein M9895_00035 [Aquamicrobium sp.]|uniref:hypothetical protein n=1 Tax=Aquamicrobium sp. TaxID=1872579 RepID=UPI00349E9374|nr:hypothetical protein [Aquamicrobium sp.]